MKKDEKVCPTCAEHIKLEALRCKHCGAEFTPGEIETLKKGKADLARKRAEKRSAKKVDAEAIEYFEVDAKEDLEGCQFRPYEIGEISEETGAPYDVVLKRLIELGLVFIDKPRAAPPDEWSETLRAAVDRDIRLAACDGVLSRDAIFRIQDKHNVQDAFTQVLDNGLAYSNLKGEIVDAEHRRKEREDWIASRERQRTGSADWKSNLVPMGCMALIVFVALYVVISIAGGGSPQTPQQRLEQQMKEGQRDVCRKWGSLADGC